MDEQKAFNKAAHRRHEAQRAQLEIEEKAHIRPEDAIAEPLTPQSPTGRCGRCLGLLATDTLLNEEICRNCGRVAERQ